MRVRKPVHNEKIPVQTKRDALQTYATVSRCNWPKLRRRVYYEMMKIFFFQVSASGSRLSIPANG